MLFLQGEAFMKFPLVSFIASLTEHSGSFYISGGFEFYASSIVIHVAN